MCAPMLFKYATAVVLFNFKQITWFILSFKNDLRAKNAALSSRILMCSCASTCDHLPPVVRVPMEAPQPILEASDVIVISAVGGSIRLPFNKCRLFIHHNKSALAGRVRSICWS